MSMFSSSPFSFPAAGLTSAYERGSTGLETLRAVVLLSGSVWPRPWMAAIGRSILDLPLESERSVLGHWIQAVGGLADEVGLRRLALRVILCRAAPIPTAPRSRARASVPLQIERDNMDFRGTGGVLRDLSVAYDKDDYLLVASGAQVLVEDLSSVVRAMGRIGGDVVLLVQADGTAGTLMLIRCGALADIAPVGFVDLKEQGLPVLAARHRINVLRRAHAALLPIRTAPEYLSAIRGYRQLGRDGWAVDEPGRAEHVPAQGIVEAQARVEPSAVVHDAVVLGGGTVGAGAVVARSIICEGATVARGQVVVNRIVTSRHTTQMWLDRPWQAIRAPAPPSV